MLSPYENIVIGNFLYGLGLLMGREPGTVDGCINLTQQTKLDGVLGDVMLQFTTTWRLIEFKRYGARMSKQHAKLAVFQGAMSKTPSLERASRAVHWYVESGRRGPTGSLQGSQLHSQARPYLDLRKKGGISMERLAEDVVKEACHGKPIPLEDLDLYMQLIKAFGCLDGSNTAGLLVGVSSSGGLAYVPLDDVGDLRETAGRLAERALAREHGHLEAEAQASRGPFSPLVRDHLERTRNALPKTLSKTREIEQGL